MTTQDAILLSTSLLAILNPVASAVLFGALAGKFSKSVGTRD
jgi:small neutral amino acid transporter SnatA (MarC family)